MSRRMLALTIAVLMLFAAAPTSGAAADPTPSPSIDTDADGLSDGWEALVGTDPATADTDGDGLLDGGDPDIIAAYVATLDDVVFAKGVKGVRVAISARVGDAESAFLTGDIALGIQMLQDLSMRFDGCPPEADADDWVKACDAQIAIRSLIDLVIANHFSFTIDPTLELPVREIPGLSGGPAREVVAVAGPDGVAEYFVDREIIVELVSPDDLTAILARYQGTVLRDGTPLLLEGGMPNPDVAPSIGYALIDVNTAMSPLDDLPASMESVGLVGEWTFSSESAARLVALMARESDAGDVALNFVTDLEGWTVLEHPDGLGGNIDFATQWWMTEDDNPATPAEDGLSVGVIRAWEYLRYQGFPPTTAYYPTWVAVVDSGFDLDETTGVPLYGRDDFFYSGAKPPQLDEIDYDWTAGGIAKGFANCPNGCWHGQLSFGACCANGRNLYGTAGTSGGGTAGAQIYTMLIRVGPDVWQIATGVYDAIYNNADVINTSIAFDCGSTCFHFQNGNVLKAAVNSARNVGSIVVASAGNDGQDISNANRYPCEIDGAICVGAVLWNGLAWDGSNYGSVVDMWAPTGIRSTVTRDTAGKVGIDALAFFNGTSCSSPYLAGIVALMKTLNPWLYKSQVLTALENSVNTSADSKVTPGYVDALRALQEVKANAAPSVTITMPTAGGSMPYGGGYVSAAATDPEKVAGPWGIQFDLSVTFSSNRQGVLCSDDGPMGPYSCETPPLWIGDHIITATVSDAFGATASHQVAVTVANAPPVAVITYPASPATYYTSQTVHLAGFGFDPDQVIQPGDLEWSSSLDGTLGTGLTVDTSLSAGIHEIKLTVTDEMGAKASDAVTITVLEGAGYPSATITSPATGAIVGYGDAVTLVGVGTDPEDGTLSGTSLVWTSDRDGHLGTGNSLEVVLSGEHCLQRSHVITLTVADSDGHVATHSIMVVVVELC